MNHGEGSPVMLAIEPRWNNDLQPETQKKEKRASEVLACTRNHISTDRDR